LALKPNDYSINSGSSTTLILLFDDPHERDIASNINPNRYKNEMRGWLEAAKN